MNPVSHLPIRAGCPQQSPPVCNPPSHWRDAPALTLAYPWFWDSQSESVGDLQPRGVRPCPELGAALWSRGWGKGLQHLMLQLCAFRHQELCLAKNHTPGQKKTITYLKNHGTEAQ